MPQLQLDDGGTTGRVSGTAGGLRPTLLTPLLPPLQAELWRHVRHVRKMYYQVWGPQDFARGRPGRNAAVKVDPQRLGDLIETAIHEMEPF